MSTATGSDSVPGSVAVTVPLYVNVVEVAHVDAATGGVTMT